eukprot:198215_1
MSSSRAQDFLMQIVSLGYGFDVPEIQKALIATNYKSTEDAVQYLFNNKNNNANTTSSASASTSSATTTTSVSASDIQSLKERISKMEIEGNMKMNVSNDLIENAIKNNKSTDDALNFIMDKYSHLIKPNSSSSTATSSAAAP